ncbi:MAG TPA: group 1 truncated hemoglobin [Kofleriaceae bacterium]|nr:group 1 truncated hemoglobin [Kofleriaceae bacterium]
MRTVRLAGLALGVVLAASACGEGSTGAAAAAPAGRPTLFVRLGGIDGIRALVDELTSRLAADERIQRFFAAADFRRFKGQLVVQLCALTGGPCRYRGKPMAAAHRGLGIERAHFDAFLEDLDSSLESARVGARERGELAKLLGAQRAAIVGGAR